MHELIYQEVPENQREQELRSQCSSEEEREYRKYFSEEELKEKNAEYVKAASEFFRKEQEIKSQIATLNASVKTKKAELAKKLGIVDNGFETITGKLFLFDDQAKGDMYIYDTMGVLIEKRRLRPEERQLTAFRKVSGE